MAAEFTAENAENALATVAELCERGPRDAGTVEAGYAAQWIAQKLRAAGLRAKADTWREATPRGMTTFSNIFADIPGEMPDLIILGSHYDTKSGIAPDFTGANDGGSSTGLLLELAKVLKQAPPPKYTVRLAFFDGEECIESYRINDGLHGSRRMAEQVAGDTNTPVRAVIILDMVGDRDLNLIIPRNVSPPLAKVALDAAQDVGHASALSIGRLKMVDDHWPFLDWGIPAIVLIDFEYGSASGKNDYWHTPEDTVDKLSAESLGITGRLVLAMLRRLDTL
ncbi:MAG: M28 family metallopeptidase [Kiritimatiellaeota bacterium]|nr:M28 family metallopeptidase [Kiritimatiellota bacterium]